MKTVSQKPQRKRKEYRDSPVAWTRSVILILLTITSFRSAVADWNDVPTGSMKPTILEGDRVYVNKLAYDLKLPYTKFRITSWSHPERGDIIVFFSPVDGTRMIKRVIGLPGDEIELRDNELLINGVAADYEDKAQLVSPDIIESGNYRGEMDQEVLLNLDHAVIRHPYGGRMSTFEPVVIPEGQYFVMGDNRDDSLDSRWFGFVPREEIAGRATAVAISVDPEDSYKPRLRRFFSELN